MIRAHSPSPSSPSSVRNSSLISTALAATALVPVLISMLAASLIISHAIPSGFSCGHVWVFAVFCSWVFSCVFTNGLYLYARRGGSSSDDNREKSH